MKAKVNWKYHVYFVSLGRRRLAGLLKCYRTGPVVGVGVDQDPGVGVGTAPPPRLVVAKLSLVYSSRLDTVSEFYLDECI